MKKRKLQKTPAVDGAAAGARVTALDTRALMRQVRATVRDTVRTQISTVRNSDWLGPGQPVPPQAPEDAADIRVWDYPVSYNVNWQPRKYKPYSFAQLRWLADNFDLLREVIERRKDEISTVGWDIVAVDEDLKHSTALHANLPLLTCSCPYPSSGVSSRPADRRRAGSGCRGLSPRIC